MRARPFLLTIAALGAAALVLPASGSAEGPVAETTPTAPEAAPAPTTTPATTAPAETTTAPAAPQVQTQYSQGITPSSPAPAHARRKGAGAKEPATGGKGGGAALRKGAKAVSPATLTPGLPLTLQSGLSRLPGFFIESFAVPPFLLPIFQAAGTAYDVPWQVLAAINEVETDYGRDLSVSSAGAEGWMQFLPSSWTQYGVDANGDGYADPYNPADAIFAAARYLRAAGAQKNLRAAIFSYNHSQAYVDSVMLRAQLLGGTTTELLGAITGLTEARFPVHAAAHFSDGFATLPASGKRPARQLVGTTIYAAAGSPVIAVQDGEVAQIGSSAALGRFVVLRDAFGNTYTYAHLAGVASLYPVITPHVDSTVSSRISASSEGREPTPNGPATAGVQPRSPLSEGATASGLAGGAAGQLGAAPTPTTAPSTPPILPAQASSTRARAFRSGANDVYLHPLKPGVQVIAGTVLGRVGGTHMFFQIRPAGLGAPLIDPKPILDGWVALGSSSVFGARGENPFLGTSPTTGQVLLESKQQLEPQVLRDGGIRLSRCGRADVAGGRVDRRVLAALEYLAVSGLKPTAGGLPCSSAAAGAGNPSAAQSSTSMTITAINGLGVAGHQSPGSLADEALHRLLMLQGLARPQRVVSAISIPGAQIARTNPRASAIRVTFAATGAIARAAALGGTELSPAGWIKLVARLGEIPDPTVSSAPSSAAIRVTSKEGAAGGHH
jgi:murein DD-endopeptidase MepM/ murein hydrolase activator NlpD